MARQCCVCMRKLGIFSSGGELDFQQPGNKLCDECYSHKKAVETAQNENDLNKKMRAFRNRRAHYNASQKITEMIDSLEKQAWESLARRQKMQEQKQIAQLERFGGVLPMHEFSTDVSGLLVNYTNLVCVFEDRVVILRNGNFSLNRLPGEITIFYKDISSILFADEYGRARITITVPGMMASVTTASAVVGKGISVGGAEMDYYSDPCTIVFGMHQVEKAREQYNIIRKAYDKFKSTVKDAAGAVVAVQQDSAVDKLKKLKEIKDIGILSDSEYEEKRQKLLSEI